MTDAFKSMIDLVATLPEEQQDFVAAIVRQELKSEERWDQLFADPRSEFLLDKLAAEAAEEFKAGRTKPLDPDRM